MGFKRVVIIGAGLIGGSIAGTLRKASFADHITACDLKLRHSAISDSRLFDSITEDFREVVTDADLVLLCAPVKEIIRILPEVMASASSECLVIDTGSVKRSIMSCTEQIDGKQAVFIGGHPMAGKEVSGIENADPELFRDTNFFLVCGNDVPKKFISQAENFVRITGAKPVRIDAEEHDRIMALISHFPQILSTMLINWTSENSLGERAIDFSGPGFKSMARLSGSSFDVWQDIIEKNNDFIKESIDSFANYFNIYRDRFSAEEMEIEFSKANTTYENKIK